VLKLVDRIILRFIDIHHKRSSRFSDKNPFVQWLRQNFFNVFIRVRLPYGLFIKIIRGGFSLTGKTTILHIDDLGSTPELSKYIYNFLLLVCSNFNNALFSQLTSIFNLETLV
jgi:hypothetical protein